MTIGNIYIYSYNDNYINCALLRKLITNYVVSLIAKFCDRERFARVLSEQMLSCITQIRGG